MLCNILPPRPIRVAMWKNVTYGLRHRVRFRTVRRLRPNYSLRCAPPYYAMAEADIRSEEKVALSIGTFNVLAPCHKRERTNSGSVSREALYPHKFLPRHQGIVELLRKAGPPDVICLQEFSCDDRIMVLFQEQFGKDFQFHFYPRPGTDEGLMMMVRHSLSVERVVQQQLGGSWSRIGLHTLVSFKGLELQVLVSTTHLEFPHHSVLEPLRINQIQSLLKKARDISLHADKPVATFLCGDFNASPECGVYQSVQKSGFASAYHSVHQREPAVTHRDHRGNSVAADYVFYRSGPAKPLTAQLYPEGTSDKVWPSDFTLSDHRLLVAHFEVDPKLLASSQEGRQQAVTNSRHSSDVDRRGLQQSTDKTERQKTCAHM